MTGTGSTAVAVVAAVAAGCAFAVGSVLQQRAARAEPADESLSPRLILGLLHRRDWLVGVGSDAISFGLQALALAFGPLALVQPLIVCELLFAVPLAARLRRQRLGARDWAGTISVAGGLVAFLAAAAPSPGRPDPRLVLWLGVLAAVVAVSAVAVVVGRLLQGPARATLYALGAAALLGLLAALTKSSTHYLGQGAVAFFTAWQPYGMAVVAAIGEVLQQSAFQAGPLAASLPMMNAGEPAIATLIGIFAFGERIRVDPLSLAAEAVGVLLLLSGIVVLDRSPLILRLQRAEGAEPPERRYPASRARNSST